jgi:hypothetical protein
VEKATVEMTGKPEQRPPCAAHARFERVVATVRRKTACHMAAQARLMLKWLLAEKCIYDRFRQVFAQ